MGCSQANESSNLPSEIKPQAYETHNYNYYLFWLLFLVSN